MEKSIVLFDGCCDLCSRSVQFVVKRDPGDHFRFVSIQSDRGKELLQKCGVNPERVDAIVLIEEDKCYTKSDAALRVTRKLGGMWPAFSLLRLVPRSFRNRSYDLIARNRHYFFRRSQTCMLPSEKDSDRFLY